ncbi:MAG: tetratricopeptide repeat protein [Deltaproteobacteria bacterium]
MRIYKGLTLAIATLLATCLSGTAISSTPFAQAEGARYPAYAFYLQAVLEQAAGRLETARDLLEQALAHAPDEPFLLLELAHVSLQLKDLEGAKRWAEMALAKDPDNSKVKISLARIHAAMGNLSEARIMLEEVLSKDPQNRNALFWAGTIAAQAQDIPKAIELLERAKTTDGDGPFMTFYYLGLLYRDQGNYEKAISNLKQAIELNPGLDAAWKDLADTYNQKGDTEGAIKTLRSFVAREPGNLKARDLLIRFLMEKRKISEARDELLALREMGIGDVELDLQIARLGLEMREFEETISFLQSLSARYPADERIFLLMSIALEGKGDREGALAVLEKVKGPRFADDSAIQKAGILLDLGRKQEAFQVLDKALLATPDKIGLTIRIAELYLDSGQLSEARRVLQEANAIHPDDTRILFSLVMLHDKEGARDEALALAQRILALDGKHPGALNYIGYTYAEMGIRLDEAESLVRKALESLPDDGFVMDSLGWVLFKKGRYDEAVQHLKRARELAGGDPTISEHLGDAYYKAGQLDEAIKAYQEAMDLLTGESTGDIKRIKRKIRNVRDKMTDPDEAYW